MGVNVRKEMEGGGADRKETDEYGAVAGAHRPQPIDLNQKRCHLTACQRANNIVLALVIASRVLFVDLMG